MATSEASSAQLGGDTKQPSEASSQKETGLQEDRKAPTAAAAPDPAPAEGPSPPTECCDEEAPLKTRHHDAPKHKEKIAADQYMVNHSVPQILEWITVELLTHQPERPLTFLRELFKKNTEIDAIEKSKGKGKGKKRASPLNLCSIILCRVS